MQKCSLCSHKSNTLYQNKGCQHCYCNHCLNRVHIPDKDKIECLANKCLELLDVNQLEDFFMNKMIQQIQNGNLCYKQLLQELEEEKKIENNVQESIIIQHNHQNVALFKSIKQSFIKMEKPLDSDGELNDLDENERDFCGVCFQFSNLYYKLNCKIHRTCLNCFFMNNQICNLCHDPKAFQID